MKILIFDLDDTLFDTSSQLDETYKNLPNIRPFPETEEVLKQNNFKKVLVSRGNPQIQEEKINVLNIKQFFDDIVWCRKDEDKLSCFRSIINKYKANKQDIYVIGNRIDSEIRYGKMLGLRTIHFMHGKYASLKPQNRFEIADHRIKNLKQILDIIK